MQVPIKEHPKVSNELSHETLAEIYEDNADFKWTMSTQGKFFSPDQLERIENCADAHIDDPQLLIDKKAVTDGVTPLSALNMIK